MRIPIVFLAAALSLAACSQRPPARGAEPGSASSVLLYDNEVPECPYREAGVVSGRTVRDIKSAAFAMRANAVLLEPSPGVSRGGQPLEGTAIQFLSVNCRK
jgi:hypothetical protein